MRWHGWPRSPSGLPGCSRTGGSAHVLTAGRWEPDESRGSSPVTHARTAAAKFLGYEITVQHGDRKLIRGRRAANGVIALRVPMAVKAKCARYLKRGKPERRTQLMNADDHTVISTYGAEYRGIVQYYLLAGDVHRFSRLNWVMVTSLLKTLAGKYDSSVPKMAAKYAATVATPHGPRRCFQVSVERGGGKAPLVARYGGIPLRRQKMAVLIDRQPVPTTRRKELISRLLAGRCEMCGNTGKVDVHQVRKLADLGKSDRSHQPAWAALMAKRRRKTLVVCPACHDAIHPGRSTVAALTE